MIEKKILDEFVAECKDDYVGLWSFVSDVKVSSPVSTENIIRSEVISILTDLCINNNIKVGDFDTDGNYRFWNMSIIESMKLIEKKWTELDGELDIGDIAWFTILEKQERM